MPDAPTTPTSLSDAIDALPVVTEATSTDTTDTGVETAPADLDSPGTETTEQENTAEAAPETDTSGEQTDAQPEPEELDPADPLDPDKISADGKQYFFRAAKAKQLLAARDFKNAVEQSLGPDATVENIKNIYERIVGVDTFLSDFDDGSYDRVGSAANWFFDNAKNRESLGYFADHVVARLANEDKQAFGVISNKVLNGYTAHLYNLAQRTNDEKLFRLAQNIDFQTTGRFRKPDQVPQQDPFMEERRAFDQERQQFYQLRQQEQARTVQQAVDQAETAAQSSVDEEISKALQPIQASLKALPNGVGDFHLKHITRDLKDAVESAVNANPAWQKKYQLALDQVKRSPSAESRERLVTMVRQFAAPIIARAKGAAITAATGNVLGQNAAAHAKQAAVATRREPAGTLIPTRRPGIEQKIAELKKHGMGAREGLEALFGER